jgi:hypothetical protein
MGNPGKTGFAHEAEGEMAVNRFGTQGGGRGESMKVLHDDYIPGCTGGSWVVKKGQHIRIIDVDGGAVGDFVTFNANNLKERFSQARTKANQGKFMISTGDRLYTRDNNVLLTIAEDTYGIHDLEYGMCSAWVFQNIKGGDYSGDKRSAVGGPLGPPTFGCYEIIQGALKDWPIAPEDIPDPLNVFQTVEFDFEKGTMGIVDGRGKPGDYIDFVAEMDTLCALSAGAATGKPLRTQVYEV